MTRKRSARKVKPVKAWAISEGDELPIFDHRLPLYWLKKQAVADAKKQCFNGEVVRVTITVDKS